MLLAQTRAKKVLLLAKASRSLSLERLWSGRGA